MSVPKFLNNFNIGAGGQAGQTMDVKSGIRDIYIANVGVEEAEVSISLAFAGDSTYAYLLERVKIPPQTTLDVLEGRPIRMTTGKAGIVLRNASESGVDINVTYVSV